MDSCRKSRVFERHQKTLGPQRSAAPRFASTTAASSSPADRTHAAALAEVQEQHAGALAEAAASAGGEVSAAVEAAVEAKQAENEAALADVNAKLEQLRRLAEAARAYAQQSPYVALSGIGVMSAAVYVGGMAVRLW